MSSTSSYGRQLLILEKYLEMHPNQIGIIREDDTLVTERASPSRNTVTLPRSGAESMHTIGVGLALVT